MKMKTLSLNFQNGPWSSYRSGVAILLFSIMVTMIMVGAHVLTVIEINNQEGAGGNVPRLGSNTGAGTSSLKKMETFDRLQPELKRANEVVRQLAMPWDQLFNAIEVFDPEQVALLRIETDTSRHSLTITAVSKSFNGMLGYMKNLNKQASLINVYLIDHKLLAENGAKPVQFSISTSWNEGGE